MNRHNLPMFTHMYFSADLTPQERGFINKFFETSWHAITEEELALYKETFESRNFTESIYKAILRGVIFFILIIVGFFFEFYFYSSWMIWVSFLISMVMTTVLYLGHSFLGPEPAAADVCILPVYATAAGCYYTKGVKNEYYYAVAFYGHDKKKFRIPMSDVSTVTDIMMVSVGRRTEYMPLKIKEHELRYSRSGIFIKYCDWN